MRVFKFLITLFQFNRTNWTAVFLCGLIAAVFWLFNTLAKEYATNVAFPLSFDYDTERYVPAEELPRAVTLNVTGKGWELLRRQSGLRANEIILPLERPAETGKLATTALLAVMASQLNHLTINFAVTDTLRFRLEPREQRKLKISVSARALAFRGSLGRVSRIVVLPDSAEANGPASLLRALPDSVTLELPPRRVTENYREQHLIALRDQPHINFRPTQVTVLFEVAEMQNMTLRLPLRRKGQPPGTDSVACQMWVPAKWKENGSEVTRTFYAEVPATITGTVQPEVRGIPDFVTIIRVDSVNRKTF